MRRVLRRRVPRDVRAEPGRLIASVLLILVGVGVGTGVATANYSALAAVLEAQEEARVEDGHLIVTAPLADDVLAGLDAEGVETERTDYTDQDLPDGSTLRLYQDRERINQVTLDTGTPPQEAHDIVVERLYAQAHGIAPGDTLTLAGRTWRVTGLGTSPDYSTTLASPTDASPDHHGFGTAFITAQAVQDLHEQGTSWTTGYSYRLTSPDPDAHDVVTGITTDPAAHADPAGPTSQAGPATNLAYLDSTAGAASAEADPAAPATPLVPGAAAGSTRDPGPAGATVVTSLLEREDNPRITRAVNDTQVKQRICLLAAGVALVVIAYVLAVLSAETVRRESPVIGTLYALGLTRSELVRQHMTAPVLLAAVCGVVGTAAGVALAPWMQDTAEYYSYPQAGSSLPLGIIAYGLTIPVLSVTLVTWGCCYGACPTSRWRSCAATWTSPAPPRPG